MNKLLNESSAIKYAAQQCSSKTLRSNPGNWRHVPSLVTPTMSNDKHELVKEVADENEDNESESTSSFSTSASMNDTDSEEIPVYVKGEQRFISGITEHTTCADLIEALLQNEATLQHQNAKDYVLTERWKRVENVLENKTKILKIWTTWGGAQSEVKFSLRRIDQWHRDSFERDKDSGRGSPTGSINSAIVRRKKHRASKSSIAWMTHGQTIHPKSQKNSIERLMKLILEQGEIIQQQLFKLRDRELQITNIEDERHRLRERDYGKNYLLETYLNGLHVDEKEQTTGNSDSGIHTEETTTSPEIGIAALSNHDDEISDTPDVVNDLPTKKRTKSRREAELLLEHRSLKEFNASPSSESGAEASALVDNCEVQAQVELLEKLVVLNKHLQREEELMVRLGAKIKRYEADASGLTEIQIKEALNKVDTELTSSTQEIQELDAILKTSENELMNKNEFLKKLYQELEENEIILGPDLIVPEDNLNLSREYLAENIYNISKNILKTSSLNYTDNEYEEYIRHTPEHMLATPSTSHIPSIPLSASPIPCGAISEVQVQVHQNPQSELFINFPPFKSSEDFLASMNYLEKYQRNSNLLENNVMTATNIKLGPKKLLNTHLNQPSTSSQIPKNVTFAMDAQSLGVEDFTQLGTLV